MTSLIDSDAAYGVFVEAAVRGDRQATSELLARLQPRVVRYCRARIIGSGTDASADDVAQETLFAVLTALPSYRNEGHGFGAFVFGIAGRKVADFYRRKGRDRTTPAAELPDVQDECGGPEQSALRAELVRKVQGMLGTLSESQRDILVCRLVVGLSAKETADLLSTTPGAVRVAQHRALEKLRGLLGIKPRPV
ncbi:RNA polymerase sigma factor ShbA [Lentzea sp. NBRC 102530]|uniref:RNA polymerase sigma factor ShbA n=1 Tax=Lentzea sp. NBRC 102530 TaxID=3032201 RepID=UPI0024A35762|nr:RNA polymerase sigma factor ShbA [Lentzea sp. NBRC 102530]GLY52375.1 putative RNA polymerase sigma-D factor [Lentzea sp. NBRC 102530]